MRITVGARLYGLKSYVRRLRTKRHPRAFLYTHVLDSVFSKIYKISKGKTARAAVHNARAPLTASGFGTLAERTCVLLLFRVYVCNSINVIGRGARVHRRENQNSTFVRGTCANWRGAAAIDKSAGEVKVYATAVRARAPRDGRPRIERPTAERRLAAAPILLNVNRFPVNSRHLGGDGMKCVVDQILDVSVLSKVSKKTIF